MSVSVTTTKKKVKTIKSGNLHANGTEQTLIEFIGSAVVSGYVDLSEMQLGNVVVIKQSIKLKQGTTYRQYAEETYNGPQKDPVLYFTPKRTDVALKITLQQTTGLFKNFDNNFIGED